MERTNYVVLGAGKQGTAAAFELALNGGAGRVLVADKDGGRARASVETLKRLLGRAVRGGKVALTHARVDGAKPAEIRRVLQGSQAVLSALPYYLNPGAAAVAVAARTHYCDLGGYLDATKAVLKLDAKARRAGVTLVPDCGLAPGMCNTLAACAMEVLAITREVSIYCGGLPQKPRPPLGYKIVFSLEGLLGNYFGKAFVLRKGEVARVPTFTEREVIDFGEPIGPLEAFVTGGATSTCPWTFQGRLQNYDYKTLRYPGHHDRMMFLRDLGMLGDKPVQVNGQSVVPREVFKALAEPRLRFPDDKDVVVLRVVARGQKEGKNFEVIYDLVDYYDPKTGFSAMERTTGFSAAVVLEMLAQGVVRQKGAVPLEKAVPGRFFLEQIRKRGLRVQETIRTMGPPAA